MITDVRVRSLAREEEVTAGLAEKHYVNSWVLYGIYTSRLDESLVFKGGTALSKLYFRDIWRFSEDLDFTAMGPLNDVEQTLETALGRVGEESGIRFDLRNVHKAGDPIEYIQIDIQYDAVLGQRNTTDLDITLDEPLAFPVVDHEHAFEDIPSFRLSAYTVEEIFVEKLRSLFQRARARDYYDVYRLLEEESFEDGEIVAALREKAGVYDVELDLATGLNPDDVEAVRAYWGQSLNRLVTELPEFDTVVERIDAYLRWLGAVDG